MEDSTKNTPNDKGSKSSLFSFLNGLVPNNKTTENKGISEDSKINRYADSIEQSNYLSRDLSWLKFNERVLDQAREKDLNLFERLKFLAITASNLDEFFTIRLGSLYNYLDFNKERIDYSGLREIPFRKALMLSVKQFCQEQDRVFKEELVPKFAEYKFRIIKINDLTPHELEEAIAYFDNTIYPMLTPMLFDHTHAFPVLIAKTLIFGVVTDATRSTLFPEDSENKKLSFVQIPSNLPRFYTIERGEEVLFLPIEEIVRHEIKKLYRNVEIQSVNLFRIVRNGDFTLEESDDIDSDFIDEIKQKIKSRRLGRVVHMEIEPNSNEWMLTILQKRFEIDKYNIFFDEYLIDYTCLWQIIRHPEFQEDISPVHPPITPARLKDKNSDIFEVIREKDILLHHPYNNFEPVLQLIEQAAEDPDVLAIKLTIYRLAKRSRVTQALLKAAENGKHVSVLFEIKARFDEENNIREADRLQRAGCFVIYGIGWYKTHTKLMLIVRKEGNKVTQYAHLASGNYNEDTARLYTDIGILTSNPNYTRDISEFFNVITGHSQPAEYNNLITSPRDMRDKLIEMIRNEAENAKKGLPSGICIKLNSMEDQRIIDEMYKASQAGVKIKLIIRGICCLRPGRKGLSENITVRSIVGLFLEHARIFYFHNNNNPKIYGGSADIMVRSFDKRIESLFEIVDSDIKYQMMHILDYNLRDNVNAYELQEDGTYKRVVCSLGSDEQPFDIHQKFFEVRESDNEPIVLFEPEENQQINTLEAI
ncbi:Polyphosphate kinase [Emticicia oligotrophica DSM 17448]|uniref:Polyphosphate kinase n=1 Tax=Emticicia oligotrophica (strain DSM 17448 / CIP 109782 / MTCC 6937 / GPTSA100-15) TaxID=929562 RepID=A0ABM5MXN7_EMTOG|nr:polyphosphate kinase 1 [Emticicia oligotrophica]AFK01883.1 Polyphosphate kinase [Emticicia oligotrophica DSM 17448]